MIPTVKESEEWTAAWGSNFKERCFFCRVQTVHWHWRTNQPICLDCAKTHKVVELPKCTPSYKPPTKKQFIESCKI